MVAYLAVIVFVSMVFTTLMVTQTDSKISTGIETAVCRIISYADSRTCASPPPAQAEEPPAKPADIWPQFCVSSRDKQVIGSSVHIGFFKIGSEFQLMREDSFEEGLATDPGLDKNGLGHFVYLTFVPQGYSASVTAKAGGQLNFGPKFGAKVSAELGINFHAGDIYRLPASQADKLIKKIKDWESYQADRKSISPFLWAFTRIPGVAPDKPKIPDPAITFYNYDVKGDVDGSLGLFPPRTMDNNAKYTLDGNVEVNAEYDPEHEVEHRYIWTNPDGSVDPVTGLWDSVTGTVGIGANLGADVGVANGGVSAGAAVKFKLTMRVFRYDHAGIHNGVPHAAGDLRDVRFVMTTYDKATAGVNGVGGKGNEANGSAGVENADVTTRTLEVDTNSPESRQAVQDWLDNSWIHLKFPSIINDELLDGQVKDPGPLADPFDKLAYDTGMGWREMADQKTIDKSFGFDLSLGPGVGFNIDDSHLKLDTNRAEILDHPANGQRSYIDFPQCTATENQ